jgi:hypothetical protein
MSLIEGVLAHASMTWNATHIFSHTKYRPNVQTTKTEQKKIFRKYNVLISNKDNIQL